MRYYDSLGQAGYPISRPCTTMPCSFDEHRLRGSQGGVDYAVGVGSPIPAPTRGRVRNWTGSAAGNAVDFYHIDDNGVETNFFDQFMHLKDGGFVAEGVYNPGDTIGYSGNTGFSTGPHIHWNARLNGRVVRQWEYFREDPPKPKDVEMIAVRRSTDGAVFILGADYMHHCSAPEWGLLAKYYTPCVDLDDRGLAAVMWAHNIPAGTEKVIIPNKTWSREAVIQQLIESGGGGGGATPAQIAAAVDASLKDDFAGIPKSVNDDVAKRMGS
jgi:murein DD-endopeptidase MepM/ murein hydrolase activator NlpD